MDPTSFSGSNILGVKEHNRRAILLSLLHSGGVSTRVELTRQTSLSSTTITNITAELIEQGILDVEPADAEAVRRVGRPRVQLRLVPGARFAVGVHIGIGLIRVALTDVYAELRVNQISHFEVGASADEVIEEITRLVDEVIKAGAVPRSRVVGVGIGASGLVDTHRGINVYAPRLGWHNVAIRSEVHSRLELPVCVDNNVRSMALGEAYFGAGKDARLLAFVYGRIGVGAGFVFNKQLFRGSGAGAGEIGHTIVVPKDGATCTCGKRGCLETLVSEPVMVEKALKVAKQHPNGILAQSLKRTPGEKVIVSLFDAARSGDPDAIDLVEECACHLGVALANLVNVLNPELILLGGMFATAEDLFLPVVKKTVRDSAFAQLGKQVQIQTTSFGWKAGVIGAASLALTRFFYQQDEGE